MAESYRQPTHMFEAAHVLDLHELQEQVELLTWLIAEQNYYRLSEKKRRWRRKDRTKP